MDKKEKLEALFLKWEKCEKCSLHRERKTIVFGNGNPDAQILVVGEAPGEHEDKTGQAFVGKSGALLDRLLGATSADPYVLELTKANKTQDQVELRNELSVHFFWTNVVACHPPDNADPAKDQIQACKERLYEIIYIVDPILIMAVGGIASNFLLGKKFAITHHAGELFEITIPGRLVPTITYPMITLLHPAYLMRHHDFAKDDSLGAETYRQVLYARHLVDSINRIHYNIPNPTHRPELEDRWRIRR